MRKAAEVGELIASAMTAPDAHVRAPAKFKSRLYSRLIQEQADSGPLRSLSETRASGTALCVFEELVRIGPVSDGVKTRNCCRACHARVLAEHMERAPIYWPHCPYVQFQNR